MAHLLAINSELIRLYEVEGLSMENIARRFSTTRQGVHYRLKRSGVTIRPTGRPAPPVSRDLIHALYVDQKLSARQIGERLKVTPRYVYNWLRIYNVKSRRRGARIKYPEIGKLQVGESIDIPRPQTSGKFQHYFYPMAHRYGTKISVKTLDDYTVRLTRTA